jgi:hypothetical protein
MFDDWGGVMKKLYMSSAALVTGWVSLDKTWSATCIPVQQRSAHDKLFLHCQPR